MPPTALNITGIWNHGKKKHVNFETFKWHLIDWVKSIATWLMPRVLLKSKMLKWILNSSNSEFRSLDFLHSLKWYIFCHSVQSIHQIQWERRRGKTFSLRHTLPFFPSLYLNVWLAGQPSSPAAPSLIPSVSSIVSCIQFNAFTSHDTLGPITLYPTQQRRLQFSQNSLLGIVANT